jgi:hypothetical protein
MSRQYDDIPVQGQHRKGAHHEETSTNVRAQQPVLHLDHSNQGSPEHHLSNDESARTYRIKLWQDGDVSGQVFADLGSASTEDEYRRIMERLPDQPRFLVFENSETGDVYYDREGALGGDWTGGGQFTQVTIFNEESAAAAYVESRQSELAHVKSKQ